jgi:hypothetical protein
MKLNRLTLVAIAGACLFGQTPPTAKVIRETAIGPVIQGLDRASVCPSGTVVAHNGAGDVVIVSKEGAILARHLAVLPENTTASACNEHNKLFAAAKGYLYVYDLSSTWEVVRKGSFYVAGIGLRLLPAGEELYVLGYARVNGTPVLIRRHRWSDGTFLGTLDPRLPLISGRAINRYLPDGSLVLQAGTRPDFVHSGKSFSVPCVRQRGRSGGRDAALPCRLPQRAERFFLTAVPNGQGGSGGQHRGVARR